MSQFLKDSPGQKLTFTAVNREDGSPHSGSLDLRVAVDDAVGPAQGALTDLGDGLFLYEFTQAETDGDVITLAWTGTQVVPGSVPIYTTSQRLDELDFDSVPTGARQVTVTVSDGSDPIQNATVRFTQGMLTWSRRTDADGEAEMALDDGSYTLRVTRPGYQAKPKDAVVDGDTSLSVTMTAALTDKLVQEDSTDGSETNSETVSGDLQLQFNVTSDPNPDHPSLAYRLQATVLEATNIDPNIFVYETSPAVAVQNDSEVASRFNRVATPPDMQELPVGEPEADGYFFRLDTVDLYYRTTAELSDARDQIRRRVKALLEAISQLTVLKQDTTIQFSFVTDEP